MVRVGCGSANWLRRCASSLPEQSMSFRFIARVLALLLALGCFVTAWRGYDRGRHDYLAVLCIGFALVLLGFGLSASRMFSSLVNLARLYIEKKFSTPPR